MRTPLILAATLVLTGSAFAQFAPMGTGQFCVRGDSGANKGIEICNYQSMAQCEAARGPADKCFPNAQLKSGPQAASVAGPKAKAGPDKMKSAAAPKAKAGPDKMKSAAGKSKSTTGSGSRN